MVELCEVWCGRGAELVWWSCVRCGVVEEQSWFGGAVCGGVVEEQSWFGGVVCGVVWCCVIEEPSWFGGEQ